MCIGRRIILVFPVMLVSASLSLAQVSTAELSGTVADPTGAVINSAKIIAANAATGVSREVSSDPAGNYVMTLLPPGNYTSRSRRKAFADCCRAESLWKSISVRV